MGQITEKKKHWELLYRISRLMHHVSCLSNNRDYGAKKGKRQRVMSLVPAKRPLKPEGGITALIDDIVIWYLSIEEDRRSQ